MRIVIIGANFAGLTTAINLPQNYKVSVIDCRPQFEFLPNIHELLSGIKNPDSLRMDRKRLIEGAGHRFEMFATPPGGDEFKMFSYDYTRAD